MVVTASANADSGNPEYFLILLMFILPVSGDRTIIWKIRLEAHSGITLFSADGRSSGVHWSGIIL